MKKEDSAYKRAGVDIDSGYKAVDLMREYVNKTLSRSAWITEGGYNLLEIPQGYKNPLLTGGADGVGTKMRIAIRMEKFDTIGIDAVAMCVNDILRIGAKPILFMDYIACGKMDAYVVSQLVKGVAEGCVQSGCPLIGGESAEMPGFYEIGDYDLAGFSMGIVEKEKILDSSRMEEGDIIIGIESSGLHSNGYSLARKVLHVDDMSKEELLKPVDELHGKSLGEELLTPTRIYVKPVHEVLKEVEAVAISHITGGGFYEKVARSMKEGFTAVIDSHLIQEKDIFSLIQKKGDIAKKDMYNTFNMGVGMTLFVKEKDVEKTISILSNNSLKAYRIGYVKKGDKKVEVIL